MFQFPQLFVIKMICIFKKNFKSHRTRLLKWFDLIKYGYEIAKNIFSQIFIKLGWYDNEKIWFLRFSLDLSVQMINLFKKCINFSTLGFPYELQRRKNVLIFIKFGCWDNKNIHVLKFPSDMAAEMIIKILSFSSDLANEII